MGAVLVVEDDHDLREELADILRDEGYEVVTAAHGGEALAQLAAITPCVVLLDLMMPVMNGWELREHMRADARAEHVPVLVMSAARDELDPRALRAAACLPKPLDVDVLVREVSKHCSPPRATHA